MAHRSTLYKDRGFDFGPNWKPGYLKEGQYKGRRYEDIETNDQYGFQPSRVRTLYQVSSITEMRAEA